VNVFVNGGCAASEDLAQKKWRALFAANSVWERKLARY
jgi:hypothetical protein